jgi:hypothetical protein
VPTDAVLPHIVYQSVADTIAWLANAFGFIEHYRYGDPEGPVSGPCRPTNVRAEALLVT